MSEAKKKTTSVKKSAKKTATKSTKTATVKKAATGTATKKTKAKKTAAEPAAKRVRKVSAKAKIGGKLRIKQVRSGIGHTGTMRRTLRALGLRHHQAEVVIVDNPSVRGMVHQVQHLVRVTEEV